MFGAGGALLGAKQQIERRGKGLAHMLLQLRLRVKQAGGGTDGIGLHQPQQAGHFRVGFDVSGQSGELAVEQAGKLRQVG